MGRFSFFLFFILTGYLFFSCRNPVSGKVEEQVSIDTLSVLKDSLKRSLYEQVEYNDTLIPVLTFWVDSMVYQRSHIMESLLSSNPYKKISTYSLNEHFLIVAQFYSYPVMYFVLDSFLVITDVKEKDSYKTELLSQSIVEWSSVYQNCYKEECAYYGQNYMAVLEEVYTIETDTLTPIWNFELLEFNCQGWSPDAAEQGRLIKRSYKIINNHTFQVTEKEGTADCGAYDYLPNMPFLRIEKTETFYMRNP